MKDQTKGQKIRSLKRKARLAKNEIEVAQSVGAQVRKSSFDKNDLLNSVFLLENSLAKLNDVVQECVDFVCEEMEKQNG